MSAWVIRHLPEIIYVFFAVVFLLLCWAGCRANLKKAKRQRQVLMPFIAIIPLDIILYHFNTLTSWVNDLIGLASQAVQNNLPAIVNWWNAQGLPALDVSLLEIVALNILVLVMYHPVKRIILVPFDLLGVDGENVLSHVFKPFYEYDEKSGAWFLKGSYAQVKKILRFCLVLVAVLGVVAVGVDFAFPGLPVFQNAFHPVFPVLMLAEVYYFLDGMTREELEAKTEEETLGVKPSADIDYTSLVRTFRKLFGSRMLDASSHREAAYDGLSLTETLELLRKSEDEERQLAAVYLAALHERGGEVDFDRARAMVDIMNGRSVVFSSPFYRDFTDYVIFAVNRALMRGSKVLFAYGPNSDRSDVVAWAREGSDNVTSVPGMWQIAPLQEDRPGNLLDIGLVSYEDVNNYAYLDEHRSFIASCDMIVLFSPSDLLTTCQVGLNMMARMTKPARTCIAFDINVDGLVDSLSHALMTEFVEVRATANRRGVSNVIHWDADGPNMSQTLFDDVTRYLGGGTELAAVALKNGIEHVDWYANASVPMSDARWLALQYYRQLCSYIDCPVSQNDIDKRVSYNRGIWAMEASDSIFAVVEDEQNNLFEMYRQLATRGRQNVFLNVMSSDYLLREYMYANGAMYRNDPKAIPMVAADYVMSLRNTLAQVVMELSVRNMKLSQVEQRLRLVGYSEDFDYDALIDLLAEFFCDDPNEDFANRRRRYARAIVPTIVKIIDQSTFRLVEDEQIAFTKDKALAQSCFRSLRNAFCVAEDEQLQMHTLGSRLSGHICQQLLPGEFTTIEGKYYEVLEILPQGDVLLRRSADHFHDRKYYRQLRTYGIFDAKPVHRLGRTRKVDGIDINLYDAYITVRTDGYLAMTDYGDFSSAHCKTVFLDKIPSRVYCRKNVISVSFDGATRQEIVTLSFVLNELLRTLYPNDYPYVSITCPHVPAPSEFGENEVEKTEEQILDQTTVEGDEADKCLSELNAEVLFEDVPYDLPLGALHALNLSDSTLDPNAIYIIEDSQIDLGLLSSIDRNLNRMLGLARDYLDWHVGCCDGSATSNVDAWIDEIVARGIVKEAPEQQDEHPKGLFGYLAAILSGRKCQAASRAEAARACAKAAKKAEKQAAKSAARAEKKAQAARAKAEKEARAAEAKAAKEAKAAQKKAEKEAKAAQRKAEKEARAAQKKAEKEARTADAEVVEETRAGEEPETSAAGVEGSAEKPIEALLDLQSVEVEQEPERDQEQEPEQELEPNSEQDLEQDLEQEPEPNPEQDPEQEPEQEPEPNPEQEPEQEPELPVEGQEESLPFEGQEQGLPVEGLPTPDVLGENTADDSQEATEHE